MKNIKREQVLLIVGAILKSIGIIIVGYILATSFIVNEKRLIIEQDGLLIDINPNIKRNLDNVKDYNLKDIKKNRIIVTNNDKNKENTKYQIILTPTSDFENDIMINLNGILDKKLKNFKKEDNYYIIFEGNIDYQYSSIIDIKMYTKGEKNIKVNFKLKVKRI